MQQGINEGLIGRHFCLTKIQDSHPRAPFCPKKFPKNIHVIQSHHSLREVIEVALQKRSELFFIEHSGKVFLYLALWDLLREFSKSKYL